MEKESKFLFERNPKLLDDWNYNKNVGVDTKSISYGSKKMYWWTCFKCKSDYESSPEFKSRGRNCPFCAGKQINRTNSIEGLRPDLALLWHPTLNGNLTPNQVTLNSNKKYWWHCKNCNSDYDMPAIHKSRGIGCPYCSGRRILKEKSLAMSRPDLMKEWDYDENFKDPNEISPNSHSKAHWKCANNHKWEANIKSRNLNKASCPYCASRKLLVGYNDMWTTNPEVAKLLADPEDGFRYMQWSKEVVNWKCHECKTLIESKRISDVNNDGIGCPKCGDGVSVCEKIMYNTLIQLGVNFETQKGFEWSKRKRYDFYIPSFNLIIETHGSQHYTENGFSSLGGRTLEEEQFNDSLKENLAKENGIANYVVIDCRRSRFEFVKENILLSSLSTTFDLSFVNWNLVKIDSLKSLKAEAIKLWNSGNTSLSSIANTLSLSENTVRNYIA